MNETLQKQFEQDLSALNLTALMKFLEQNSSPCWETELMQVALPNLNILDNKVLKLYKAHFLLFHTLHKLKDYYVNQRKYLHINFMKTFLIAFPEVSKCRFYNENNETFCSVDTLNNNDYCSFHLKSLEDAAIDFISDKFFYLDIKNYFALNESNANAFINGTWELLNNYSTYQEACQTLDLPENTKLSIVKKRFRYLAKKYHPDISNNDYRTFSKINIAYRNIIKYLKFNS